MSIYLSKKEQDECFNDLPYSQESSSAATYKVYQGTSIISEGFPASNQAAFKLPSGQVIVSDDVGAVPKNTFYIGEYEFKSVNLRPITAIDENIRTADDGAPYSIYIEFGDISDPGNRTLKIGTDALSAITEYYNS